MPGPSLSAAQSPDKAASVERFFSVVKDVLAAQEIDRNKHFLDVGGDSLDAVIVSEAILGEFGIGPELDWFFECSTVNEVAEQWWTELSASGTSSTAETQASR